MPKLAGRWPTLLLLLAACGSVDEGGAIDLYAKARCEREMACSPYLLQQVHGDLSTCITRTALAQRGMTGLIGTSLTPAKLAECARALPTMPCLTMLGARALPEACRPTPGALEDDLTCGSDWQCQSAYCSRSREGACGVCKRPGRSREPCAVDADCEVGLSCAENECVTDGALGDSCDPLHRCAPGLHCQQNVCIAAGELGATCDSGVQTSCDLLQGLTCPSTSSRCEPIGMAADGESCGRTDQALVVCRASGVCSEREVGVCLAAGGDGQACTRERCLPPSVCSGEVCRLPEPARCL